MISGFNLFDKFVSFPGGEASASQVLVETKQGGVAYQSRVQVVDRNTGTLFWLGKTNPLGNLRVIVPFKYSTKTDLLVTAVDDTGTYNAVVADRVQAELMP